MKNRIFKNVFCGMALLAMAACVEEDVVEQIPMEAEIEADIEAVSSAVSVFGDEEPSSTRTYIYEGDVIGTKWRPKETIGVYGSYATNAKFTGTNTANASTVKFSGLILGAPKYAYYPYSSNNNGVSQTAVKGTMPAVHPYNSAYKDIVGDYRAGVLDSRSWFTSTFTFNRLVSIVRLLVDATGTELEGDKIQSVAIKVSNERKLSGDFTINLKTQEIALGAFTKGNDSLTLQWDDQPTLAANEVRTAYLTSLPTIKNGDELTFTIRTDKHVATFKRTSKVDYAANTLYKYTLTLSTAGMTVTEISTVEPTPEVLPELLSMKFTVADNPGKILSRKFSVSTSAKVTTSSVSEEVCTIDQENKTIKLYVPYLNNRKLVPVFELSEDAALILENGDEVISGETEVDFTLNKQIGVMCNGAVAVYDVELTNTGLPVVVVNQLSGVDNKESNSKYTKASSTWYSATGTKWQPKDADWSMEEGDNFMVYNADGTSALTDKSGNVVEEPILASTRVRGNVTQQMPKKPFAVKLDSKSGVLDMPAHKRWVLLANWKDRTLMRNEVAFGIAEVFKQTFPNDGLAWNPSGQHVELVYNGVHVGTYYLCEQIKIDGNRLDINDPYDEKDGYSGNASDYGYLLEADDGYDETWKFTTACYVPFLFKDDGNDDMLSYAANFVRGIEDNLYAGNYTAAYEQLDLTSVVDYWLIQELMMNSEMQHPKSAYMYINDGKLYAGPIWDFDWNTLPVSTSYSEERYSYTASMLSKAKAYHKRSGYPTEPMNESDKNYMWYPMLVKDAEFKNLAAERWGTVKGAVLNYVNTITTTAATIAVSEALNNAMWPVDSKSGLVPPRYSAYGIGGGYCGDEGYDFNKAVETLTGTLKTRINGMDYVTSKTWPSITYGSK